MNFKGTPGPWIIVSSVQPPVDGTKLSAKHIGTFDIKTEPSEQDNAGLWLAAVHPYECSGFPSKEEAAANAKLIAASPDMFDAIKKALEIKQLWFPAGDYSVEHEGEAQALQSMFNALEAAINKATS